MSYRRPEATGYGKLRSVRARFARGREIARCLARWNGCVLATTIRLETAKFSKPCPKGRARYYLRRSADAGSIPGSTSSSKPSSGTGVSDARCFIQESSFHFLREFGLPGKRVPTVPYYNPVFRKIKPQSKKSR